MSQVSKQLAIYLGLLLVNSTYTLIAPFYPIVAQNKGLPLWLIGVIFALNPLGNIICTPILSKYLPQIGRKRVVIASFVLTSLSMFILSPIEYVSAPYVILLSVISRLVGGMGASCLFTTVITIFISEYSDQMQKVIGRMEASIGLGLILGPMLGTLLYMINLFAAMTGVGVIILLFVPLGWKMLGEFREYQVKEVSINRTQLFFKPRILLGVLMSLAYVFSFGFLASILEIHLHSYGLGTIYVALCFMLQSTVYVVISLTGGYMFKGIDERLLMLIGEGFFVFAYLLLGPWKLIFPNEVWVVIISLPLFSVGQSLTYSMRYVVFSIPFMVNSAVYRYRLPEDDILTDVISAFSVLGQATGEVIGPIFAGTITEYFGIEACCTFASILSLGFFIVFLVGSGYLFDVIKRKPYKKSSLLINTKVVPNF